MPTGRTQDLVAWTAPEGPDLTPIRLLHGDHDGSVVFGRKRDGGKWESIGSVDARQLETVFPEFIAPLVDTDGYFGINGFLPTKFIKDYSQAEGLQDAKIRRAMWGTDKLRYLTACWVDIDFYKIPGMTLGGAVGAVIDLQDQGHLPPATMLVDSGRGLWVFWLLRENESPVRAWAEPTGTWNRIQRALTRRLEQIEPDYGAKDGARVTRVPGSKNSKSGRRVRYWLQADANAQPFTYRLDELAALLDVRCTHLPREIREAVDPKNREKGVKGLAMRNRRRLDRLIQVIQHRGRVAEGCRNRVAVLLANFMHGCKVDEDEIRDTLDRFGRLQCDPPMTDGEIERAYKDRRKYGMISDALIGDWTLLTDDESAMTGWPAKGAHDATTDAPRSRADRRAQRHSLIRALMQRTGGEVPSIREIREYLDEFGDGASVATIRKDLIDLGIVNPRARDDEDEADDRDAPLLD